MKLYSFMILKNTNMPNSMILVWQPMEKRAGTWIQILIWHHMTLVKEGKRRKRCGNENLKLLHKMKMKSLLYIGVPSVESKSIGFGFLLLVHSALLKSLLNASSLKCFLRCLYHLVTVSFFLNIVLSWRIQWQSLCWNTFFILWVH